MLRVALPIEVNRLEMFLAKHVMGLQDCAQLGLLLNVLEASMPFCRWQEERRKRYPTDANVAKRASDASARRQRGELDPEAEARQLRLHEVIARQQEQSWCMRCQSSSKHCS